MLRKDHRIIIEQNWTKKGSKWTTLLLEDSSESRDGRLVKGKWQVSPSPGDYSDGGMQFGSENMAYSYYEWKGHGTIGNIELGFLMQSASHKQGEEGPLFWSKICLVHVRRTAMGKFEPITVLKDEDGAKSGAGILKIPEFRNQMEKGPIVWSVTYSFQ